MHYRWFVGGFGSEDFPEYCIVLFVLTPSMQMDGESGRNR
jgi:hypothetical protein